VEELDNDTVNLPVKTYRFYIPWQKNGGKGILNFNIDHLRLHQERRGNIVDSDTRWVAQDKAGDLCYIDDRGWIYVDRLKELIKYKGYEVSIIEWSTLLYLS
jgi:hypothetical protein